MSSQNALIDGRRASFARLSSRVLETLNEAVTKRQAEGRTISSIADRVGRDRSAITRALNGTSANLTLRTISDILWAADFDPQDFKADPIEEICPNWTPEAAFENIEVKIVTPHTQSVILKGIGDPGNESKFQTPQMSIVLA
jgi:transcriptional regulator with XRE-family HTH domain